MDTCFEAAALQNQDFGGSNDATSEPCDNIEMGLTDAETHKRTLVQTTGSDEDELVENTGARKTSRPRLRWMS